MPSPCPDPDEAEVRHALWRFESRAAPLLPRRLFARRVARIWLLALVLLAAALGAGMFGYRVTERMGWIDAFANAAMILSGMGPLASLQSRAGKIFAGCYALFSGLAFITIASMVLSPFIHRLFHRFHLDGRKDR